MRNVRIFSATTDTSDGDTWDVIPLLPIDTFIISGSIDCSKTLLRRFSNEYGDGLQTNWNGELAVVWAMYIVYNT